MDVVVGIFDSGGMPFGCSLNASTIRGTPILRQIEVASRAGFGGIELWFADIDEFLARGGSVGELRAALDASKLAVPTIIYMGGWMEAPEAEWSRVRDHCRARLRLAAALRAPYVIACPPAGRADPIRGAVRYRELLEAGCEEGALPAMEFLGFVEQFNTIESALEIVERAKHPAGTVVLDPFHVFRGGGSMEAILRLTGSQIAVAHFNDAPQEPPREKQHDADRVWPGEGVLPLESYVGMLRRAGYTGWLSIELFRPELWSRDPGEVARIALEKMRPWVEA